MSVDLADLVPYVENRVNGPGGSYVVASEAQWVTSLANGFWSAKNDGGFFKGYREEDGEVFNVADPAGEDLTSELQQVIVLWTAYQVVYSKLLTTTTRTRASAGGGLETEVERSATLLVELARQIRGELDRVVATILGTRYRTQVGVLDGVLARDVAIAAGVTPIVM